MNKMKILKIVLRDLKDSKEPIVLAMYDGFIELK